MADSNLLSWLFGGGGGQQPVGGDGGLLANFNGAGTSYGDVMGALNNNRNMIAGLGLGLMSGSKYNPYGNVMQGFTSGAGLDIARMKAQRDNLPNDVKEYQYAKSIGQFDGTYTDWLEKKANLGSQFGLNPQYYNYKGPNGEDLTGVAQLSNRGAPRGIPAPEGGTWAPQPKIVQTPQGAYTIGPGARPMGPGVAPTPSSGEEQPSATPGFIPKDNRGVESQKVQGKAEGQAQVDLPVVEATANRALAQLEQLRSHPGRNMATGTVLGRVGEVGGSQADFISRLDQIKSQAFVSTYKNDMKGGGQISNIEGEKGTKARARLDRLTRPQDFDAAINDLEDIIRQDVVNARQRAGGKSAPAQSSGDWTDVGGGVRIRQK